MNWLGGLQVWSESSRKMGALEPDVAGEWLWVKPRRDCAIVNLAMRQSHLRMASCALEGIT